MSVPWREENVGVRKGGLFSFFSFFFKRPTKRLLIARPTGKGSKYLHV